MILLRRLGTATLVVGLFLAVVIPAAAQNADRLYSAGRRAFDDGNWSAAATNFGQFIREYPEDPRADGAGYLGSVARLHSDDPEGALRELVPFSRRFPTSVYLSRVSYWEGQAHYALGDWESAEEAFLRQIAVVGQEAYRERSLLYLGAAREYRGDLDGAAAAYGDLAETGSERDLVARALHRRGLVLLESGQPDEAVPAFRRLMVDYGDAPYGGEVAYWLGECRLRMGEDARALGRFQGFLDTVDESPYRADALIKVSRIHLDRGDPRKALAALDDWEVEVDPGDRDAYRGESLRIRAAASLRTGQLEAARAAYRAVLADSPSPEEAQRASYDIAQTWLGTADSLDAVEYLDRAAEGPNPGIRADALFLGGTLALDGGMRNPTGRLVSFVDDFPGDLRREEAARLLAARYRRDGKTGDAIGMLDRLLRDYPVSPYRPEYRYTLAELHRESGNDELALSDYAAILREAPRSPWAVEARSRMGLVYALRGEYVRAAEHYVAAAGLAENDELRRRSLYSAALAYHNADRGLDALVIFDGLIDEDPAGTWSAEAAYYRGEVHYNAERWEDARVSYLLAAETGSPKLAYESLYAVGWTYFRDSDWTRASESFRRAAGKLPGTEDAGRALYRAGLSLAAAPLWEEALSLYQNALDGHRGTWREEALYQQAWALYNLERPGEADAVTLRLREEFPRSTLPPDLPFRMGEMAFASADYPAAITWYDRCVAEYPNSATAVTAGLRAALAAREAGIFDQAARRYGDWIAARPGDPGAAAAARSWGETLRLGGDPAEAESAIRRVEDYPVALRAPVILAWIRVSGPGADSGGLLEDLIDDESLPPAERSEALLLLAHRVRLEGRPRRARDIYEVIVRDVPGRLGAEAQEGWAQSLVDEGRTDDGIDAFLALPYLYPDQFDIAVRALRQAESLYRQEGRDDEADRVRKRREELDKGPEAKGTIST